jgi:DNA polymerase sigma
MSQKYSYSDDNNNYFISPFNFKTIEKIRKVPSSPNLFSKYSKNKPKISFCKEKDKSSKKTKSTSITTNITNNNTNKSDEHERNKIYNNLTNILSQFLLNEELLLNSNFIPQRHSKNITNKNISKNLNSNDEKIFEYLLLSKKENGLPYILEPNKDNLSFEKCYFYKKLSENIVSFYNEIIYKNEIIYPLKRKLNSIVLKIINQEINKSLKPYNIINLVIYGSQASGLSLPESDIDLLLIYYDSNNSLEKLINELYKCLQVSHKFFNVTSLPKASSPLIKIAYKTNSNEMDISILHMDISFHNIFPNKTTIYFTPSLLIVRYIQRSIEYLPQSKNIIIIIKKYLKNIGLNNYYTGGLSSFSIFLLVFSFYKYIIKLFGNDVVNNFYIGQFLIQFLDFFSKFNFNQYIININKEIPFIIKEKRNICEICEKDSNNKNKNINQNDIANAVILDPFTLNNIACNSFRINEIQQKFDSLKYNLLSNYKKLYKIKNTSKKKVNSNNYDNFNKNKSKSRDNHYQYNYNDKNLRIKELINTDDFFNEGDWNNLKNDENKKNFEEYEKELDLYNNDISPNFLELSIK